MIFCCIYFGIYENWKKNLAIVEQTIFRAFGYEKAQEASPLAILISGTEQVEIRNNIQGGVAGSLAWFGSFPLDVIKSILQGSVLEEGKKSSFRIARERWNSLGMKGFYTGIAPSVVRAFFVAGCRFSIFEFALKCIDKIEETLDAHK